MNIKRFKKFYKGDTVKFNFYGIFKYGEIITAPTTYACDTDFPNIGDYYIISENEIGCRYVVNSRDIYHYETEERI